uniref:Patatin n=1 Tax=Solibacter usitatus (strain Ellin6076) TaxID=234267 RepID=Q01WF4_SOLUE
MDTPDLEKEVRFALVMYGGVSLAVYINGVAQEFYSLVRATSGVERTGTAGTEAVYRKLGAILGANGADLNAAQGPIRTRFIVDILSGTSAGGLNSIYLAKALANGLDFGVMEKLWVDQADIATLLNDNEAASAITGGFALRRQKPPQSLLSSERMYALLLSALAEMDGKPAGSALVEEVDLFVTATDLRGLETRLKLADDVVIEKRHRNVFHFCASPYLTPATTPEKGPRNDFDKKFNPFLAFAARCTAAFPIAFEPMRLSDIDAVLDRCTPLKNDLSARSTSAEWRPFLVDYIPEDDDFPPSSSVPYRFRNRSFADGGYLNNKPFSYAIEELGVRGGYLPYERKLVYIEPSPETIEEQGSDAGKPDAIENAFDAAFALPRYQTIREDLRHVVERNRLVTRIQDVIEQLEQTVAQSELLKSFKRESADQFAGKKLTELGDSRGPLYAGYHRLKIKTVTDGLCSTIGAALDLDESSDEIHALYFVLRAWVQARFQQESANPKKTESRFLLQFDLSYRERRLYFLLSRLDALYAGGEKARSIANSTGILDRLEKLNHEELKSAIRGLRGNRQSEASPDARPCPVHKDKCPIHGRGLVPVLGFLRRERNELRRRGELNPLAKVGPDREGWKKWLGGLLEGTDEECAKKGEALFRLGSPRPDLRRQLLEMLDAVNWAMKDTFVCAAWHVDQLLGMAAPLPADANANAAQVLRYCLRRQYDAYDFYDAVSFPILYGTETATLKPTAVHRISPRDATSLIDEAEDSKNRTKLAGDSLSAFGAFFQKRWRKNDLMWGRLDGAERIIGMLLPGTDEPTKKLRAELLREAQGAILAECLHADDVRNLLTAVAGSVVGAKKEDTESSLARQALEGPGREERIRAFVEPDALVDYVRESYAIDKTYQPEWTLPVAARVARVTGELLEFLAAERKWNAGPIVWVVRLTRLFWGMVEVAIPQSLSFATFRYLLGIYWFAGGLIVLTGLLLGQAALTGAGWKMLGAGVAVWLVVQMLHEAMSGRGAVWRVLRLLVIALLALLIVGGLTLGIADAPFWLEYFRERVLGRGPSVGDLLHGLGVAAGSTVLAAIAAWTPDFSEKSRKAAGVAPALTMELGRTPQEIRGILATKGDRSSMRMVQYLDFALIAGYAFFFVMAAGFERGAWGAPLWLAAGAAGAGLAAAVFDVLEDVSILRTLALENRAIEEEHVGRTRRLASAKWTLFAIAELLLAAGAAGSWMVILGIAGICGLAGMKWHRLLIVSMGGFGLVVLAGLVAALLRN